ncbi:MAG: hypothetical protein AVDCRST_MAG80-2142 [uncultured Rubrobacteraceae bacterium]|uniref:Uncharacterized protein n=1 Tax=uncultured Rubrobacteraceae bacterium TaxID=349277 RepID=A0A6J4QNM3_9ACTN|nr:MAG: hypothetical protein AVDCRST_MAG80-2142 [uncultured Rubrobacteraceae bacterium]
MPYLVRLYRIAIKVLADLGLPDCDARKTVPMKTHKDAKGHP